MSVGVKKRRDRGSISNILHSIIHILQCLHL
jgi:hypothetical protein